MREAAGLTPQKVLDWPNVDAPRHSFHPDIALPRLTECFFGKVDFSPEPERDIARAAAETEVEPG